MDHMVISQRHGAAEMRNTTMAETMWEYETIKIGLWLGSARSLDGVNELNEKGQDGWEAVGALGVPGDQSQSILLKRRLRAEPIDPDNEHAVDAMARMVDGNHDWPKGRTVCITEGSWLPLAHAVALRVTQIQDERRIPVGTLGDGSTVYVGDLLEFEHTRGHKWVAVLGGCDHYQIIDGVAKSSGRHAGFTGMVRRGADE